MTVMLIQQSDICHYPDLLRQMLAIRAEAFGYRHKWDVQVTPDGLEFDWWDLQNPLYILSVENDQVMGACRELPTTRSTMVNEVFRETLPDGVDIRNDRIWEQSRFSLSKDAKETLRFGIRRASVELLLGALIAAKRAGIESVASVVSVEMGRLLKIAGSTFDQPGPTVDLYGIPSFCGFWEVSDRAIDRLLVKHKISLADVGL